eukprot:superscaffoldBa00000680_g6529
MADREGLPIAPGQVYIEVEYDYEYKAKDKMVSIRQGECYMLVKKTNEDWWQVRKEEGTKAFYVPAQYVREVRRALMPPQKPTLRAKPTVLDICRASNENLNRPQPEMSSFGRPLITLSSSHLHAIYLITLSQENGRMRGRPQELGLILPRLSSGAEADGPLPASSAVRGLAWSVVTAILLSPKSSPSPLL